MRKLVSAWNGFQFELFFALICLASGLPLAFGVVPSPTSVTAVLPKLMVIAWGCSLSLGGGCISYGILWRFYRPAQFIAGLYVERAGLYMLSSAVVVFILAVTLFAGAPSFFAAALYGAFVAACISRSRSISLEINIIRSHGDTV